MTKSFTLLLFGATGDLSKRKLLPALYNLYKQNLITDFTIIALGRKKLSTKEYRAMINKKNWHGFAKHIFYEQLDFTKLCSIIKLYSNNLIYYLAVPPNAIAPIVTGLAAKKLCRQRKKAKIIIEKPFGSDLTSARKLNKILLNAFNEEQIYRIDHYLGKETVQNIMFFRFANSIFEPIWNSGYINKVEIMVAEKTGIKKRAAFYEQVGVICDIVQNHLMQLITLVAMEPPRSFSAEEIRDKKVKLLRTINIDSYSMGQYPGYRQEKGIAKNSQTPTYFKAKILINNNRWQKVPFYVFTGKKQPKKLTEITITFKEPHARCLEKTCARILPNKITFTIQPQEKITITFNVKEPGQKNKPQQTAMHFSYQKTISAYERLLLDCIKGDATLFTRKDEVEELWRIVSHTI